MKTALVLAAIPVLAQQPAYSPEKEGAMGRAYAAEVKRQAKPLGVQAVDDYTARIGERLAGAAGISCSFEVIRSRDASEPISLPGGFVLIPASFFEAARDGSEFAGMLAHSIGHIALRHGIRGRAGEIPLIFLGGWKGYHSEPGRPKQIPAAYAEAQHRNEIEADRYGIELLNKAGYDAAGLQHYIVRTHPEDAARVAGIDNAIRSAPGVRAEPHDEFQRIQAMVREALRVDEEPVRPTLRRGRGSFLFFLRLQ